ncbi:hypothetical protein GF322_01905 [Candidatus Dependentiae bacterium]|nr:hypothetical protein [Candidatus Dependentiae bacterium]
MREIALNKEEFKLFDQDDQFGFFYDEDGWPRKDGHITFDADVEELYQKYDYISVDINDSIYGVKKEKKELIMEGVIEAHDIAREVKEY